MSKLDIFWACIALIFMSLLLAFLVFVCWIYYDAAQTMRKCMMQYKIIHTYKGVDDDDWKEIYFDELEDIK